MWNALFITRFLDACGGDIAPTDDRADAFVAMTKPPADCAWAFPISLGDYNLSLWQWVAWLCVPVGKSECFASSFCAAGTRPDTENIDVSHLQECDECDPAGSSFDGHHRDRLREAGECAREKDAEPQPQPKPVTLYMTCHVPSLSNVPIVTSLSSAV